MPDQIRRPQTVAMQLSPRMPTAAMWRKWLNNPEAAAGAVVAVEGGGGGRGRGRQGAVALSSDDDDDDADDDEVIAPVTSGRCAPVAGWHLLCRGRVCA